LEGSLKLEDVWEALAEAAPYIQDAEWFRWKLKVLLGENLSLQNLLEALSKEISLEKNSIRKTDLKIFLDYLERRFKVKPNP
jgi:hypothetical protein